VSGLPPELLPLAAEAGELSRRALGLEKNKHTGNGHDACTLPSPQLPMNVMPDRSLASPKFLDAVFDELIDKRCNHYREMMGCLLSGSRRVRPVIVGCSTASPAQAIAINVLYDGCSRRTARAALGETWSECV
jgi:hypothetical protein